MQSATKRTGITAGTILATRTKVSSQNSGDENTLACKRVRTGLRSLVDTAGGLVCFAAHFFKLSDVTRNRSCVYL